MDFTQYLLIAVGALTSGVILLWGLSEKRMSATIAKQEAKITALEAKIEKYENEAKQDMERLVNGNIAIVESLMPLLKDIAEKHRAK